MFGKIQLAGLAAWCCGMAGALAEPHVSAVDRFPAISGQLLYSGLGCGTCHGGARATGPSLADLSSRVDHAWVMDFLADPGHARMPAMFEALPEPGRSQAISDVTAWLGTLGDGLTFAVQRHSDAERGSALYHEIGCVACHAPTADFKPVRTISPDAVPMPDLQKKTSLLALQHFLSNTGEYRTDQRMPQFPLSNQEALDIAAHLLDFQSSDPREAAVLRPWPRAGVEAIARGRALVEKLDCAACHTLPGIESQAVTRIENGAGKCLTGEGGVRYNLGEEQRSALASFLKEDVLAAPGDAHRAGSLLGRLNCYACHERGGIGGPTRETALSFVGDPALGDAGRIPPPLDGVAHKLLPGVLTAVLANQEGTRVRPYLKTRMPVYSDRSGGGWAEFLTGEDDPGELAGPDLPEIAKVDDLAAGRRLLGVDGGMSCITCHRWGDQPSLGIPGIDISSLDRRIRPEWFRHYLLDPSSYRHGTLMPAFWPAGDSSNQEVLDGDTEKQIGAIWAFIRDGESVPEGYPDDRPGQFELVPDGRPIIQRTFMEGVGTHAILVGFPGGINLAYDAEKGEPRLLWRGRFFDAYGTWFSRFAPFEKPLGEAVRRFGENPDGRRFVGYELDQAGNPTFLLRIGDESFEEHFAVKDGVLIRTVRGKRFGEIRFVGPEGGVEATVERSAGQGTVVFTHTYSWK
ncbi:MAG: hypothetical protein ACR2RV_04510 [Verrucomicrobiales bacterium]